MCLCNVFELLSLFTLSIAHRSLDFFLPRHKYAP